MRCRTVPLVAALAAAAVVLSAAGYSKAEDVPPAWSFKNNFSIPDSPAYLLLGLEPADILRPETPRDLAIAMSRFTGDAGGIALPHALAVEFSPLLLTAPDSLILERYQQRKYWYASRLSVAALRDSTSGASSRVAAGYRLTLLDDRTVGTDEEYRADLQVTELTEQIKVIDTARAMRLRHDGFEQIDSEVGATADLDNSTRSALVSQKRREWVHQHQGELAPATPEEEERLAGLSAEIHRRFTERYWNATVFDLAAGVRGSSPDSTGRGMKLDALAIWMSYAARTGSTSQLVVGAKAASQRDSLQGDLRANVDLGVRFYLGQAKAKAFAESQLSVGDQKKARTILSGGLEVSAADWAWINLSVGRSQIRGEPAEVVTSFRLKTGFPGL